MEDFENHELLISISPRNKPCVLHIDLTARLWSGSLSANVIYYQTGLDCLRKECVSLPVSDILFVILEAWDGVNYSVLSMLVNAIFWLNRAYLKVSLDILISRSRRMSSTAFDNPVRKNDDRYDVASICAQFSANTVDDKEFCVPARFHQRCLYCPSRSDLISLKNFFSLTMNNLKQTALAPVGTAWYSVCQFDGTHTAL